jgi:hypothetical protein
LGLSDKTQISLKVAAQAALRAAADLYLDGHDSEAALISDLNLTF